MYVFNGFEPMITVRSLTVSTRPILARVHGVLLGQAQDVWWQQTYGSPVGFANLAARRLTFCYFVN